VLRRLVHRDSCSFQVGADLGLLGLPFVQFLDAVFFFHDLAFGFWGHPGVIGEIDFCGLVEGGVIWRRGVVGDLRHHIFSVEIELHAAGVFHGDVQGAQN